MTSKLRRLAPLSATIAVLAVVTGTAFAANGTDGGSAGTSRKDSAGPGSVHRYDSDAASVPPKYVAPGELVDPVDPVDPGTNTEPTPSPKPSDLPPDYDEPSPFESVSVSDDGYTVKVSFYGDSCNQHRVSARETSGVVELGGSSTRMACRDTTRVLHEDSVTLKSPLGDRRLVATKLPTTSDELPAPDQPPRFELATVSDDRRTITVSFYAGVTACDIYELTARETSDHVYLVLSHSTPPTAGVCIAIAEMRKASVTLGSPLGDRRVVDTATGIQLPAPGEVPPPREWIILQPAQTER